MKFKFLLSTLLFSILFSGATIAQEKTKPPVKKATIVKKIIDENGNETVETIVLEGDEVDLHLDRMDKNQIEKVEVIKDGDNANIWITKKGERIELDNLKSDSNSETIRIYKFDETDDAAKNNEGNIDVDVQHVGGEQIIKITRDGVEKIIKVDDSDQHTIEMNDGEHRIIVINTESDEDLEMEITHGEPLSTDLPFLGISMNMMVDHDDHGGGDVIITKIITLDPIKNSPAEKAGIKNGDILISLDDNIIEDVDEVTKYVKGKKIGDKVIAKIIRADEELSIPIILGDRSDFMKDISKMSKEELFMKGIKPDGTVAKRKRYYGPRRSLDRSSIRSHRIKRDPCKPFVGVRTSRHTFEDGGLEILGTIDNTPARREGLKPGDVILEMDGVEIDNIEKLRSIRDAHDTGDRFKLLILRNGKKIKIKSSFNDCPEGTNVEETEIEIDQNSELGDLDIDLNIFPNPTNGDFNLAYKGKPGGLKISITDIAGKLLYEKEVADYKGSFNEQINLSEQANGTVIIQIENEGEVLIEKLILQSEY